MSKFINKLNNFTKPQLKTTYSEDIMTSIFLGTFGIISGGSILLDSKDYNSNNQKILQRSTCVLSGMTLSGSLYYLIKHLKK